MYLYFYSNIVIILYWERVMWISAPLKMLQGYFLTLMIKLNCMALNEEK